MSQKHKDRERQKEKDRGRDFHIDRGTVMQGKHDRQNEVRRVDATLPPTPTMERTERKYDKECIYVSPCCEGKKR